ncbi:hypothetical protein ACLOJK_033158 [Asimina triloba]
MHEPLRMRGIFAYRPFLPRMSPIVHQRLRDAVSQLSWGEKREGNGRAYFVTGCRRSWEEKREGNGRAYSVKSENLASATSPEVNKKASTDVGTHLLVLSAATRFQKLLASGTPPSSPLVFRCYMLAPAMVCFSFYRIRAFPLYNGSDVKLDVDAIGALNVFDEMPKRNLASLYLPLPTVYAVISVIANWFTLFSM